MRIAIGLDIEEISRFSFLASKANEYNLETIFSRLEIDYSFSCSRPESNLAVRFCAKEAAIKALTKFGIKDVTFDSIEVVLDENGVPSLCIEVIPPGFDIAISLSHSKNTAAAIVQIIDP